METLDIKGFPVETHIAGSGPPLLYLHAEQYFEQVRPYLDALGLKSELKSGSFTCHSSGSRKVTMVRSPEGSIITAEIGVTSPGMWMRCLVSMPSCAI